VTEKTPLIAPFTMQSSQPWIFSEQTTVELINRVGRLTPSRPPLWGTMNAAQMLAHCCVPYEQALGTDTRRAPAVMRWFVRWFYRDLLIGAKPYPQGAPTAPTMKIADQREFEIEKARLEHLIVDFQRSGEAAFEGREQLTLGPLTAAEWHTLLYKHLDHHLRQFGV